ncbi:unnamed protein product [Gordionus sp. m RMFG-2023]
MADLSLLVTTRKAKRMFFPPNIFSCLLHPRVENGEILPTLPTDLVNFVNFSGHGGFMFYKEACKIDWKINGNMKAEVAKQMVFHSIFGTFKEDLSILSQITHFENWNIRNEMWPAFREMNRSATTLKFQLITYKYYYNLSGASFRKYLSDSSSQLSSMSVFSGREGASLTKYLPDSSSQLCSMSVFSGRIEGIRSSDFLKYMAKSSKSIQDRCNVLSEKTIEIAKSIERDNNKYAMGVTDWFDMESATYKQHGTRLNDMDLIGTGKLFSGRN